MPELKSVLCLCTKFLVRSPFIMVPRSPCNMVRGQTVLISVLFGGIKRRYFTPPVLILLRQGSNNNISANHNNAHSVLCIPYLQICFCQNHFFCNFSNYFFLFYSLEYVCVCLWEMTARPFVIRVGLILQFIPPRRPCEYAPLPLAGPGKSGGEKEGVAGRGAVANNPDCTGRGIYYV